MGAHRRLESGWHSVNPGVEIKTSALRQETKAVSVPLRLESVGPGKLGRACKSRRLLQKFGGVGQQEAPLVGSEAL